MIINFIIKTILNRKIFFYNYLIMCEIKIIGKTCSIMSGGDGTWTLYDSNGSETHDSKKAWT